MMPPYRTICRKALPWVILAGAGAFYFVDSCSPTTSPPPASKTQPVLRVDKKHPEKSLVDAIAPSQGRDRR